LEGLDRLKQATRWMWSLGDYSQVSPFLEACAQKLAGACDIAPGTAVLDVAAGDGNFALAAAARGAQVTASDYTPKMLDLGRARSEFAGVAIEWVEGDAEDLPFDSDSYDIVASVFGAMFAPRPDVVARELFRVCKAGGTVAMANYGWQGFLGAYAKLLANYSGPAPFELPSPFEWGDAEVAKRRLGPLAAHIELRPQTLTMDFHSADAALEFWESNNPPTIALRGTLPHDRYSELRREALRLIGDGILTSSYLIVIARK
jgi:SAM-dependent methyltransferase